MITVQATHDKHGGDSLTYRKKSNIMTNKINVIETDVN